MNTPISTYRRLLIFIEFKILIVLTEILKTKQTNTLEKQVESGVKVYQQINYSSFSRVKIFT